VLAVGVALVIVGGLIVVRIPTRTFTDIQRSVDSASASSKPPAWLERVAPGASTSAVRSGQSGGWARAASIWGTVTGIVFTVVFLAVAIGTLGWAASLPLAYALTGGWLSVPRSDKRPAFDGA
jgi:ABC-type sulfate transport system permease component